MSAHERLLQEIEQCPYLDGFELNARHMEQEDWKVEAKTKLPNFASLKTTHPDIYANIEKMFSQLCIYGGVLAYFEIYKQRHQLEEPTWTALNEAVSRFNFPSSISKNKLKKKNKKRKRVSRERFRQQQMEYLRSLSEAQLFKYWEKYSKYVEDGKREVEESIAARDRFKGGERVRYRDDYGILKKPDPTNDSFIMQPVKTDPQGKPIWDQPQRGYGVGFYQKLTLV